MAYERRDCAEALLEEHPERLAAVAVAVVRVLLRQRSIASQRKLRAAVREMLGRCSDGDVDAAVEVLGASVRRTTGPRGATQYCLDVARLPPAFLALLREGNE